MTAADYFAAADRLRVADLAQITDGGGIMVLAPHPDDESLGCGGLIATAVDAGVPTSVVILSDGTGSHPHSQAYPKEKLRALREAEARAAAAALGLAESKLAFFRLPDGAVPADGADAEDVVARICAEIAGKGTRILFVTSPFDPHCDHQVAYGLASRAAKRSGARLFTYPIWARTLAPSIVLPAFAPTGFRLEISAYLPKKQAAIAAHRSQTTALIDDDPVGFRLAPSMIETFTTSHECFIEAVS
jgi:LmbE family N-acetylglucosaminyl deacetylase